MLEVTQHADVREEISQAAAFYGEESQALLLRFLDEFDGAVSEIQMNPEAWPIHTDQIRRRRLRSFPYGVLYTIHPNRIHVLALMHLHRKPGYWKERLENS